MLQSVLWIAGIVVLSVAVSIVRGIVDSRTDQASVSRIPAFTVSKILRHGINSEMV